MYHYGIIDSETGEATVTHSRKCDAKAARMVGRINPATEEPITLSDVCPVEAARKAGHSTVAWRGNYDRLLPVTSWGGLLAHVTIPVA